MPKRTNTVVWETTGTVNAEQIPDEAKPESLIDKHSSFTGSYRSTHNLRIEGVVEGQIECRGTLTIAEEARVKAEVVAQNVIVAGNLDGEVTCPGRFQILPSGHVVGKVVAGVLDIRAGAFYEGDLSMHGQDDRTFRDDKKKTGVLDIGMSDDFQHHSLETVAEALVVPDDVPGNGKTAN